MLVGSVILAAFCRALFAIADGFHLAGGNALNLRIDGSTATAATMTGGAETMPGEFPARLAIGADHAGRQPFPGAIDELVVLTDPDER